MKRLTAILMAYHLLPSIVHEKKSLCKETNAPAFFFPPTDLFFQKIIGWSCRPASAASAAGRICAKSATQLVGFARKSSC